MRTIHIDTSNQHVTRISLDIDGQIFSEESDSRLLKSQMTLPLIEELLRVRSLRVSDITDIRVHQGPGSFTGLRVGISIANALAFLYQIPINESNKLATAHYS